jgi:heat shock protein HslJ
VNRRRPSGTLALATAVTVAVALSACGGTQVGTRSATAGLPDLEQSLAAAEWLLDPADSSPADAGGTPVTLVLDGAAASGAGPCNRYRGTVELDGDDGVRITDVATTAMSCDAPAMAAEAAYLDALARVRTADVADPDRLVLTADGVRLSYTAVDG